MVEALVVYVLLWFSPSLPRDMPTFVSTWSTAESCQKKADILNAYFKVEGSSPMVGFHCLPSNVHRAPELDKPQEP
jgi:hypothetical protein